MSTRNLSTLRRNLLPISGFRDPLSIPDCLAWFDFSDASSLATSNLGTGTVTSGSTVGFARDKTGNGWNLTQGIANNRPTWTGTIGSTASLQFDGANDSLVSASSWPLSGDASWSLFAVYNRSSATAGGLLSWGSGSNGSASFRSVANCLFSLGLGTANINFTLLAESTGTSYALAITKVPGPVAWLRPWRNGPVAVSASNTVGLGTPNLSAGALSIGQAVNLANFFAGQIGELVFYSRELSFQERIIVTAYLGNKWGITIT